MRNTRSVTCSGRSPRRKAGAADQLLSPLARLDDLERDSRRARHVEIVRLRDELTEPLGEQATAGPPIGGLGVSRSALP